MFESIVSDLKVKYFKNDSKYKIKFCLRKCLWNDTGKQGLLTCFLQFWTPFCHSWLIYGRCGHVIPNCKEAILPLSQHTILWLVLLFIQLGVHKSFTSFTSSWVWWWNQFYHRPMRNQGKSAYVLLVKWSHKKSLIIT